MIPLLDLKQLNGTIQTEIDMAVLRVVGSGRYILGPEVEAFEAEWAAFCGTQHCVGVANALEALILMLKAYSIGPGDEVIVPSNTYIATWLAVSHVGARPVPVEPDLYTMNLDPSKLAAAITPRTAAVIAVHLYGLPAAMTEIRATCARHGLWLFEDAAQAHGAELGGTRAGNLGDAAAFSFYPSKNLGALGDAGAVTTNDRWLAERVRRLRSYGGSGPVGKVDHRLKGINSRLDEMQAAVLRAKLPYLTTWNAARRQRAAAYNAVLLDPSCPALDPPGHVFHQYVIQVEKRDQVISKLAAAGIDAHVHYPVPPHLEPAYRDEMEKVPLPIAEILSACVMSLPIGNDVDATKIAHVVLTAIKEAA